MYRLLPGLLAIPLIVAYGLAEGRWTNRWQSDDAPKAAAARLTAVPLSVGDWQGQSLELEARQVEVAEVEGYLRRQYTHRRTGATLEVLIVCGRSGPVALHSPEVCYQGAGYGLVASPVRQALESAALPAPAELWMARFQKNGALPEPLRIWWAWSADGPWSASGNPRWQFAGKPALYKLYVIRQLAGTEDAPDQDPAQDFMRQFLPQLHGCLFPAS